MKSKGLERLLRLLLILLGAGIGLALCVAVASSLKDRAVGPEIAVMGEIGLAGEVRTVPQCERRVSECARLGFSTLVVPRANAGRIRAPEGVKVVGVDTVAQALSIIF